MFVAKTVPFLADFQFMTFFNDCVDPVRGAIHFAVEVDGCCRLMALMRLMLMAVEVVAIADQMTRF